MLIMQAAAREAIRRDEELSSGAVVGRSHEQVMQCSAARHRMRLIYHPDAEAELIQAARFTRVESRPSVRSSLTLPIVAIAVISRSS